MNVSAMPDDWPQPPPRPAPSAARLPAGPEMANDGSMRWVLPRNCCLTPRQMLHVYLSLCVMSLSIAFMFWLNGAGVVVAFAGTELLVVGVAMLCYARHAADREVITLEDGRVSIEHRYGTRVDTTNFSAAWVRVEPAVAQGSMVEVFGEGRRATVGRYLRPELRSALAVELRHALRIACDFAPLARQMD